MFGSVIWTFGIWYLVFGIGVFGVFAVFGPRLNQRGIVCLKRKMTKQKRASKTLRAPKSVDTHFTKYQIPSKTIALRQAR
jgi:hypothetical protein